MDYGVLAKVLPISAHHWGLPQISLWLQFVHLQSLFPIFNRQHIDGPRLLKLNTSDFQNIGINNKIIIKKLTRWIKEGLPEFHKYLQMNSHILINNAYEFDKENIPPTILNRIQTSLMREPLKKVQKNAAYPSRQTYQKMVVKSYEGSLAAFYVLREKSLKIGRSNVNTIRSLQVSVQNEHAEVFQTRAGMFLRDCGSQAGTFIKISHRKVLEMETLVQMGSFLFQVQEVNKFERTLRMGVQHMPTKGFCQLTVVLQEKCSSFSIGRRKTNDFSFDDEHLSGTHAKIFFLHDQFVIEDLLSTNGTWLRLSPPRIASGPYPVEDGTVFKVGTTITYQCEAQKDIGEEKIEMDYNSQCQGCGQAERNIVLVPCHHNVICSSCADRVNECPTCGGQVQDKIKIFL